MFTQIQALYNAGILEATHSLVNARNLQVSFSWPVEYSEKMITLYVHSCKNYKGRSFAAFDQEKHALGCYLCCPVNSPLQNIDFRTWIGFTLNQS
jgi:hypothetical protein